MSTLPDRDQHRAEVWAHLRSLTEAPCGAADPDQHPHRDSLTLAHHVLMFLRDNGRGRMTRTLPDPTLMADALEEAFWQADRLVRKGQSITLAGLAVVERQRVARPIDPPAGMDDSAGTDALAATDAEAGQPIPPVDRRGWAAETESAFACLMAHLEAGVRLAIKDKDYALAASCSYQCANLKDRWTEYVAELDEPRETQGSAP